MGNTRIYSRFEFWDVDDCRCEYCRFFAGKDNPCPLDTCDIADIRREAILRECGWFGEALPDEGATPCRE